MQLNRSFTAKDMWKKEDKNLQALINPQVDNVNSLSQLSSMLVVPIISNDGVILGIGCLFTRLWSIV